MLIITEATCFLSFVRKTQKPNADTQQTHFTTCFHLSCCNMVKLVNKSHDKHWPCHMTEAREMQQWSKCRLVKNLSDASASLCSFFLHFLFSLILSLSWRTENTRNVIHVIGIMIGTKNKNTLITVYMQLLVTLIPQGMYKLWLSMYGKTAVTTFTHFLTNEWWK